MATIKHSVLSLLVSTGLIFSTGSAAQSPALNWQLEGFEQPESVISDSAGKQLFITNMNGEAGDKNGQGYISLADTNGNLINRHWITGLNAPKGMAVRCNLLYVADIDQLVIIDIKRAEVIATLTVENALFLNDVVADDLGNIYISDFFGGTLYRHQVGSGKVTPWFSSPKLPHPNGLAWYQDQLLVASWGKEIQADFTTKEDGSVVRIDPNSKTVKHQGASQYLGNLDGLAHYRQSHYVSDWLSGEIFELKGKQINRKLKLPMGAADISIKAGQLFVPLMLDGKVQAYQL